MGKSGAFDASRGRPLSLAKKAGPSHHGIAMAAHSMSVPDATAREREERSSEHRSTDVAEDRVRLAAVVRAPAPGTRFPCPASSTCFAGAPSPRTRPLAPPSLPPIAR
jgi:hypothetical protein